MDKEISYQQLLNIASKFLAEQGAEKTTMSQIAKEANVSTRTMFRYFGTKDQLVIEVIKNGVKDMNHEIDKLVSEDMYQGATGKLQMCLLAGKIIDLVVAYSMYFVCVEEVETYLVRHKNKQLIEQYRNMYTRLVKEADCGRKKGIEDGTVSEIYRDDELFYTFCNNVRGFAYRITVQLQFTDYDTDGIKRLKKNHLTLIEKLLLP